MCGIFGIYNNTEAAANTALGLRNLQHRGQEAAGIVTYDGERFYAHRNLGLVGDIFGGKRANIVKRLKGNAAIGHVRYSTTGEPSLRNIQPLFGDLDVGGMAIAHNGNLTNALTLRRELIRQGAIFQSTTDTEVVLHLVARSSQRGFRDRLIDALKQTIGAYCYTLLTNDGLYAVRDPHGIRPLCLGKLGQSYVVASESVAFDVIGAEFIRDIAAGELLCINDKGLESFFPFDTPRNRLDIFEFVYFARPDSVIDGKPVYDTRFNIGRELAKEAPVDADMVVPILDSGAIAAEGFSNVSGIVKKNAITRSRYTARTFIEPTQAQRNFGVRLKHNPIRSLINGKRVILVDDSIVRGTTSKKIVEVVRNAGAREVHFRVASPMVTWPCFYGIDTPSRAELMAANHSLEEMEKILGVDSLRFLSIDGLYRAMGEKKGRNAAAPQYEDSVFTGDYPIPLVDQQGGQNNTVQLTLLKEPNTQRINKT